MRSGITPGSSNKDEAQEYPFTHSKEAEEFKQDKFRFKVVKSHLNKSDSKVKESDRHLHRHLHHHQHKKRMARFLETR